MPDLEKPQTLNNEQFEDVLIYFSKSILGKKNEEDLLWDLAKNCIAKLGFVDCVIYTVNTQQNVLEQKAAYGPKSPKDKNIYKPITISLGQGITGMVAVTGKAEIINDTSKDKRYIVDDEQRLSEITVPIATESTIYGVLDCEHPNKGFFTHQHLKMLSTIASICAIKIENVRASKLIQEKKDNLLKIKQEVVELKLKALNTQMNPHFVFNTLNAIQYFITSENKKSALEYLSVFSKLIRFYLKHIEKETVKLEEEMAMLNWYLKLQRLRYDNQFEFEIAIDKNKSSIQAKIPSFILQTVIENIIENAIFNQHKNQTISLNFSINPTNVEVKINYRHSPQIIDKIKYTPEYRKRIMQWQDQIRLLNKINNYSIEKNVTFIKTNTDLSGSNIILKLPNLV
jgi:putative methionine-R-sulfoxide reductase with GAF domain